MINVCYVEILKKRRGFENKNETLCGGYKDIERADFC
jgi:hypothetical protein